MKIRFRGLLDDQMRLVGQVESVSAAKKPAGRVSSSFNGFRKSIQQPTGSLRRVAELLSKMGFPFFWVVALLEPRLPNGYQENER